MATIECDGKIDVRLHECQFDGRRFVTTVNTINKKQRLVNLSIDLVPVTMEKLAKINDSDLEATKWQGTLFIQVSALLYLTQTSRTLIL